MQSEEIGRVSALWRYPVKSMMGEQLNRSVVTARGLLGDRAYALVDRETSKVASAKEPKKWAKLFDCRAAYVEVPSADGPPPAVRITLPDGDFVHVPNGAVGETFSKLLGRAVELTRVAPDNPSLEEYWPDIEGLDYREAITDESMPENTFFDAAAVHVLTTATLDRLRDLYPQGRFEPRRFRPNVIVTTRDEPSFVENEWVGRTLVLGDDVKLEIQKPCARCVMTTMPQDDLPKDPGILRAAAQHNAANVGVYASVVSGGTVGRGDGVRLE